VRFKGIKQRLILVIGLFVGTMLLILASGEFVFFRHATRKLIFDQQFAMLSSIADGLDSNVITAHNALINVAKVAPIDVTRDNNKSYRWLRDRTGIQTIFHRHLFILNKDGIMISSIPILKEFIGESFAYRDYYMISKTTKKPFISTPFIPVDSDRAVIVMTAPIYAPDGSISGYLCGSLDLLREDGLFASLRDIRIGTTGYIYVFDKNRTMIMHPDTSRILKQDVQPGMNILFDKAIEGFEGSGETTNSKGLRFLVSYKKLKSTGWIIASNYPLNEAYQPIQQFLTANAIGILVLLGISVILTWKLGTGITNPVIHIAHQMKQMSNPHFDRTVRIPITRDDEIAELAHAFNGLLDIINQNETLLKNASEEYQRLIDNSYDIIYILSADGIFTFISPAWEILLGHDRNDVLGKPFYDFVHSDDQPACFSFLHEITNGDYHGREVEYRVRHKTGEWRWHKSVATPIRDAHNTITAIEGIASDIHDRKLTEFALLEERRRLTDILNGTHVGTWEWNVQTGEIIINARWAEMIGYTLEELSPISIQTWIDHTHPDDLKRSDTLLNDHFSRKTEFYTLECRMKHKNGTWIWILDQGQVHRWDNEGKPLLMSGTHQDITERKNIEASLLESEERYRKAFQTSPDAIIISNLATGHIISVNDGFSTMSGFTPEEVLNKTSLETGLWKNPNDRTQFIEIIQKNSEVQNFDTVFHTRNGDRNVLLSASVIELNKQPHLLSILRDITDKKNAELKIHEIEQKNASLSMAVTANHEINQPLMVLMGNLDVLEMKSELCPDVTKYISAMKKAIYDIQDVLMKMKELEKNDSILFENYVGKTQMVNIRKNNPPTSP